MPLPQIPLDDPRVLALAKARQQLAHDGTGYVGVPVAIAENPTNLCLSWGYSGSEDSC